MDVPYNITYYIRTFIFLLRNIVFGIDLERLNKTCDLNSIDESEDISIS